jgi:hypothetical protein
MLGWVLRCARLRLAVGAAAVVAMGLLLPVEAAARLWWGVALGLAAPWMVLGREAARRAAGLTAAQALAPRGGRLALAELLPGLGVALAGAVIAARGVPEATLGLWCWAAALLCIADVADRRSGHAGAAWLVTLAPALLFLAAPLALGPWLGRTAAAPWLATAAIAGHPAAIALGGAGLPVLQDALFYRFTLSGVVEVRPMPWYSGAVVHLAVAASAAMLARRAARRPPSWSRSMSCRFAVPRA